jgi:hypothetical protein
MRRDGIYTYGWKLVMGGKNFLEIAKDRSIKQSGYYPKIIA